MRLLSFFLLICLSLPAFAQYDGKEPGVASRFRPGIMWYFTGFKPPGRNSAPKYDRFMIDLNYNTWKKAGSTIFDAKPSSIGFALHGMFDIPLAPKNTVGLGIGLSFRVQRIRFDGELLRDNPVGSTQLLLPPSSAGRSVFGTDAFSVPVEIRFRTPGWKHVKVHAGVNVGVRTRMFTRTKIDGEQFRDKTYFDSDRVFYGVHMRLGIRNWAVFADYSLSRQFRSAQSTQLQPLTFGITCSLF